MNPPPKKLSPTEEAVHLLSLREGPGAFDHALGILRSQFGVIQSRYQFLITLSALTLTITGFSGPKIAAASDFSRYTMAAGLVFVLLTTVLMLLSSLQLRWVTEMGGASSRETIEAIICYRDRKTRLYGIKLILLATGLIFYVASVVHYFLFGIVG